jgi:TRAP-type C4-dicarboxylate transport system permease small subunit
MLDCLDRGLRAIERVFDFAAAASIVMMMLAIFSDVLARAITGESIDGVHELVEMYLMAGVVFLSVARAQDLGRHIAVDALMNRVGLRSRIVFKTTGCAIGLALMAPIAWKTSQMCIEHFLQGRATTGVVEFPTWIGWAAISAGSTVLAFRLALQIAMFIARPFSHASAAAHTEGRH